nr:MAG TPA: hypothetical protein [Caudoviricetes sp.]
MARASSESYISKKNRKENSGLYRSICRMGTMRPL